jgi:hypothetical protein
MRPALLTFQRPKDAHVEGVAGLRLTKRKHASVLPLVRPAQTLFLRFSHSDWPF